MAKNEIKYLISYQSLLDKLQKDSIDNNILLSLREKVLLDDVVKIICKNFVGKSFDVKNNLISFNAEDKVIENILNECSNIGLFSEKKVVVIRNIKKLLKNEKLALLDYLNRFNPDTCLIMVASDEEFSVDKIFLFDSKEDDNHKGNKKIIESNVKIFEIDEFSDTEMILWIKEKFEDYVISEETIKHLLQFTNYSFDEILSEIEKLKTYCYFTKEVTIDAVNLCNGISKDFNETDFIRAVLKRDKNFALKIYDQITLKKDIEVYLIFLLNSAFIIINKLFDPGISKLQGWQLKKELKLWFEDQEKLLPYYKEFKNSIDSDKMKLAFEYIYKTDKILKLSGGDRKTTMTSLINNICNL